MKKCIHDKLTGQVRWGLSTKVPLKDPAGKIIGLIGINRDITQKKISDKKIEDVNRELSTLFNSIDAVFFSVDTLNHRIIQISNTCEKLFGYTAAEFFADCDLFWTGIVHPDDRYRRDDESRTLPGTGQETSQYRIVRKDGTIRWVETKLTSSVDKEGRIVRLDGVTMDVTERKLAETELYNSEDRYRRIVETAQEGIWMIDDNNFVSFYNRKMCEILGYSYEEMHGKHLFDFMDEKGRESAREHVEKRKQGINGNYDVRYITKNGTGIWTNISTSAIFDESGRYQGALAMVTDITKRKHDEELLQRSKATLALNNHILEQKNKELEQFAYVASHDLQEPLRTTSSFVELFQKQYYGRLDATADKYLAYMGQASDRMRVLIKDLLDYSRIGKKQDAGIVNCNNVLQEVLADIGLAIFESGTKVTHCEMPVIHGYPTEIKELFQNLLLNAIKFRKKNVAPLVNIRVKGNGNDWEFEFSDNGIGIDERYYEKIFIIFQRLHNRAEYHGSGIGLSHCRKIVELHNGRIWVRSAPGEGSTFYFTIPIKNTHETKIELHPAY